MKEEETTLVLGLGNRLLGDDAAGPLVLKHLMRQQAEGLGPAAALRDGGTIGMALLPEIEAAAALVVVDAAAFGAPPGTVKVFEGAAMDAMLRGNKRTAHEVALADLMDAAAFAGTRPQRRALVAVQPQDTRLSLSPTPPVAAALPVMADAVCELLGRWASPAPPGPNPGPNPEKLNHA